MSNVDYFWFKLTPAHSDRFPPDDRLFDAFRWLLSITQSIDLCWRSSPAQYNVDKVSVSLKCLFGIFTSPCSARAQKIIIIIIITFQPKQIGRCCDYIVPRTRLSALINDTIYHSPVFFVVIVLALNEQCCQQSRQDLHYTVECWESRM